METLTFFFFFFLNYEMITLMKINQQFVTRSGVFYEVGKHGVDLLFPRRTSLKKRMGERTDNLFVDFVSQLLQVDPSKRFV